MWLQQYHSEIDKLYKQLKKKKKTGGSLEFGEEKNQN